MIRTFQVTSTFEVPGTGFLSVSGNDGQKYTTKDPSIKAVMLLGNTVTVSIKDQPSQKGNWSIMSLATGQPGSIPAAPVPQPPPGYAPAPAAAPFPVAGTTATPPATPAPAAPPPAFEAPRRDSGYNARSEATNVSIQRQKALDLATQIHLAMPAFAKTPLPVALVSITKAATFLAAWLADTVGYDETEVCGDIIIRGNPPPAVEAVKPEAK